VALVPVAAADITEARPAAQAGWVGEPWPGAVPDPAPAAVHDPPVPAEVLDAAGRSVRVSGRGEISAAPATVTVPAPPGPGSRSPGSAASPAAVAAWAGPWPCDERWWDLAAHRRRARLQATTTDGVAYLLAVEAGRWWAEATYD
jgi:protein ImuB